MENGVDFDHALVGPPEEHPPVANPQTKARLNPQALDVAGARLGVLPDAGDDADASSWIDSP